MSRAPVRMACPACSRRVGHVVASDCPICAGRGRLTLGSQLRQHAPVVLAKAILYALELQASEDLKRKPGPGESVIQRARRNQRSLIEKMQRKGFVAADFNEEPPRTQPAPGEMAAHRKARVLAEEITGLPYEEGTAANLTAPAIQYEPGATGHDFGTLPVFSVAGFVSCAVRVADPRDVLEVQHPNTRSEDHAAKVLGTAVTRTS